MVPIETNSNPGMLDAGWPRQPQISGQEASQYCFDKACGQERPLNAELYGGQRYFGGLAPASASSAEPTPDDEWGNVARIFLNSG